MKTFLTLFVLFFSSSVVAETFKCQLEYTDLFEKIIPFELFIDTGDTNVGPIVLLDKNKNLKQIILPVIQSVGKVYSDNYPSGGQKIANDAYFSMVNSLFVKGFFVHLMRTVSIDISMYNLNPDTIEISIYDPSLINLSGTNAKGFCK